MPIHYLYEILPEKLWFVVQNVNQANRRTIFLLAMDQRYRILKEM